MIHEVNEHAETGEATIRGEIRGEGTYGGANANEDREREGKTENEQSQGSLGVRVAEHDGDDTRGELGASELHRNQEGGADKDNEREHGRRHRGQHRLRGGWLNGRFPPELRLQPMKNLDRHERRWHAAQRPNPDGAAHVMPDLITLQPGHGIPFQ